MTNPILTHLLAEAWAERARKGKPTAMDTPLRYSGALGCARQMGYNAVGAQESDPMDAGDAWSPGIGTMLHEMAQHEIGRVYATAQFEVASKLGLYISGSTDCLVTTQEVLEVTGEDLGGSHVLWEFKSMGEYAFDKQVGFNRRYAKIGSGEGPKKEAITQAAMNALGIEQTCGARGEVVSIETILMGSACVSPVSNQKADEMGITGFERVGAEFRISREEWCPLARFEEGRMTGIGFQIEVDSALPDRQDGFGNYLNPRGKDWNCHYCSHRTTCVIDGEGVINFANSAMVLKRRPIPLGGVSGYGA